MTLLLNKELQRIDYVTYHCHTINWDIFSILAFFFICMFAFMAILMTRRLGACWAPTSRPPARTPDPGFWYIHHHHNHNHHDHSSSSSAHSPPATRKVYWARNSPSVEYVWLVQIVQIFAVHCENLVPRPKYLGPSSSNIQYLTRPDQKLSKNIYFIGSEWYISLYVLGKSCSVSHLQQLNLGQNYLTKIGARPDKFCHKNDPRVVVLA